MPEASRDRSSGTFEKEMIRLVVTLFLLACVAQGSEPRDRVEFAELGEDATSSFYYFFFSEVGAAAPWRQENQTTKQTADLQF